MAMLNTVLGPIDASDIGDTMSHVHLTIDLLCWHMPPESGPMRGLSEGRITMANLGAVRSQCDARPGQLGAGRSRSGDSRGD
jgi:predicted metal-dependent phosphotriesterase family hydrolase